MTKTTKLVILIHPTIDGPIFDTLREKGHIVDRMDGGKDDVPWRIATGDIDEYDAILGPNAYRMTEDLLPMLNATLVSVRRKKRES